MFRQSIDPRGGFPPKGGGGAKPKSGKRKKVGKLKKRKKTNDPFSRERKAEQAFKFGERRYGQSGRSVYDPASLIRFHQSAQFNQARDTADAKRGGGTFTGTSIGEEKRVKEAQEADILFKKQEAETKSRFVGALETLVDRTAPRRTAPRVRTSTGDFDNLLQGTGGSNKSGAIILKDKPKSTPPELTDKQKDKVRLRSIGRGIKPETTIEEIPQKISFNRPTETPPVDFQPLSSGIPQRTGEELQDLAIKTRAEKLKASQGKGGYRQGRLPEDRISRQVSQADKDADVQKAKDRRRGFVGSGTSGGGSALLRPRPSPSNPSPSIFALQRQDSTADEIKGKSILRPEPKPSPFLEPQVGLQKQISGLDLSSPTVEDKEEDIPDLKDPSPSTVPPDTPKQLLNKVREDLRKIVAEPEPAPQPQPQPQPQPEPAPQVPLTQPPSIPVDKKKKKPKKKPKKPEPEPEPEPVAPPAPRIEEIIEPEPEPAPAPKPKKGKTKEPEGKGFRVRGAEPETPLVENSAYGQLLQEEGIFAEGSNKEGWEPTPYILYDKEGLIGEKGEDYSYYVVSARGKSFGIVDVENKDLKGWNSIAKTRLDKLIKDGKIILR